MMTLQTRLEQEQHIFVSVDIIIDSPLRFLFSQTS